MAISEPPEPPVDEQVLQARGSKYIAVEVDPSTSKVSQDEEIESSAESFLAELNKLEATQTLNLASRPKKKRKIREPIKEEKNEQKDEENRSRNEGSVYYSNSSQEEETLYQKECADIVKKFRTATGSRTVTGENRGRLRKINKPQSQPRSKSPSPETDVDLKTESSSDSTNVSWMLDTRIFDLGETDLIFDNEGQISRAFHTPNLERVDEEVLSDGEEKTKQKLMRGGLKKILCGIPAEGESCVEIKKKMTQGGKDGKGSNRVHEFRDIALAAAVTGATVAGLWIAEQRRYLS